MPKSKTTSKKKTSRRRPVKRRRAKDPDYPVVMDGDQVTHVVLPIKDYEQLIARSMVESAVKKLEDPKSKWHDADEVFLQMAGSRVAEARKAAGLTQTQLAKRLKVPQSQISRIERNPDRTTIRTLKKIAKALNVDVSALIGSQK